MREPGHDVAFTILSGLYAPAATPEPVMARLEATCLRMMQVQPVVDGLQRMGMPARAQRAEYERFGRPLRQYNRHGNRWPG